jgi:PAS domain S-box-containing protein
MVTRWRKVHESGCLPSLAGSPVEFKSLYCITTAYPLLSESREQNPATVQTEMTDPQHSPFASTLDRLMKMGRINNLVLASIILTLGTIILTFFDIRENRDANAMIVHTYEVIGEANELLSSVKDAETSQRGYLITGDTSYLAPFFSAQQNQNKHFHLLRHLTRDNPEQQQLLADKIEPLIDQKNDRVWAGILAFKRAGADSAFLVVRSNAGKKAMDSLRLNMKILTDREYILLKRRYTYLSRFYSLVDITRYGSLVVITLISALALVNLFRKQNQNRELLKRLKKFNNELEDTVATRTKELAEKNRIEQSLNEELQQNMEEIKAFYEALQVQNVKTEDALEEVRDLYNYSPCGYHSLDGNGVFVRINATELEWLGYTRAELIGKKKLLDILSAESVKNWQNIYDEYKIKGSIFNAEIELVKKDGTLLPILLNSSALYDTAGNFIMSRSTIFDLTERKKIEARLREVNAALIKVNDDKNNFLGMASHDLKSPLNAILGLINVLKASSSNLTPDQLENLNFIFESGRKMKAMIDKLLDLNRIEQGKALIQKAPVDLIDFIKKQRTAAQLQADKKEITILFEDHPDRLLVVSDASLLAQIFDNLVSNALKFSPPGKKVWITVTSTHDSVALDVRDEGPGIRPEEFHKLFGKFQKLSARPTGGETSTGLGLSIVKELVDTLGGKISCQSALGIGTVFKVDLPL